MDFLQDLNKAQQQAVVYIDGPSMVIAGAGSGKTRVLTYKVVYLLTHGYLPQHIMVLTFTNKAANEMRQRIENMVGPGFAAALWMGTFHSIFARILRREADKLGYPKNFTIYDTIDSRNTIKQIIREMELDPKQYVPQKIHSRISKLKNNLFTAKYYLANNEFYEQDKKLRIPYFGEIFKRYEIRLKQAGAMDFDDLLLQTNILFKQFPEVLQQYQKAFRFILVDEYQDTNYAQYLIIKKLAEKHRKICVVGDDAQSIYAFRGARIENIFAFQKDFPEYKLFKLEQNYRSTQTIVKAANSVIAKNTRQIPKNVFSNSEQGESIIVVQHSTDYDEGRWVAEKIKELHKQGVDYSDMAILYRMNSQSRIFEDFLRQNNIPYKIYGGLSFYQRKEIKDTLAYLRLALNPYDEQALDRIINYPNRGIGDRTKAKIFRFAVDNQMPVWNVLEKIEDLPIDLSSRAKNALINFRQIIRDFATKRLTMGLYDFAMHVAKHSGILHALSSDPSPESQSRYENVQELLNAIKEYAETSDQEPTLENFLENVALLTDQDNEQEDIPTSKVNVMTIHSAKGLEFHTVFLVGLEQSIFPGIMVDLNPNDLEEERRLFYVALTRAKKQVFLSYAERRLHWGQLRDQKPSQFIQEIDQQLLKYDNLNREIEFTYESNSGTNFNEFKSEISDFKRNTTHKQTPEAPKDLSKLKKLKSNSNSQMKRLQYEPTTGLSVGSIVFHSRFGKGKILNLIGEYPDTKAEIEFENFGKKKILLKFAKLQKIS